MSDIQKIVDGYMSEVREFRRLTSEKASHEYIRDIVSGAINNYSLSNLRALPAADFDDFKNSLDDKLFSESDRKRLRSRIDDLRSRQAGKPKAEARFLGMFVEKLLTAHTSVKEQERPLNALLNTLNNYLAPEKRVEIKDYQVKIIGADDNVEVPLDKLSSGEKQIVSIFAYLHLSGQKDFILMIDESELSLSVPWQKRFVPDLISTGSCAHVVVVTHSPFVFDNYLNKNVVDVRRLRINAND